MQRSNSRKVMGLPDQLWSQHREAALNWLAFGLLLAAWNAVDDPAPTQPRPRALRGYTQVSVRAVERSKDDEARLRAENASASSLKFFARVTKAST